LTPSARSANLIAGDGTKNGLSRSEQKTVSKTHNSRLTGKAPYKFESISLQRRVFCEPNFLDHRRLEETAFFDPVNFRIQTNKHTHSLHHSIGDSNATGALGWVS